MKQTLTRCRPGQYRIGLLRTFKDGSYPGLYPLPDGTIVAAFLSYQQTIP